MIFNFLTYFIQYGNLQVHLYCCKWHYLILLFSSFLYLYQNTIVFYCVSIGEGNGNPLQYSLPKILSFFFFFENSLFYPFICRRTLQLLPCLGYYKQRCYEHLGACIFSNKSFLQITCPGVRLLDHRATLVLVF